MDADVSRITIPDGPCIELKPRTNSIRIGNRFISLSKTADTIGCTEGYLSKLFRETDREISLRMARKLSTAWKISLDQLDRIMLERKKSGNRPLSLT